MPTATACHMTELSHTNVVDKERKGQILCFRCQAVSHSSDTTIHVSTDNPNTIGNAQEHLVSLYISKMNLCVGDVCKL